MNLAEPAVQELIAKDPFLGSIFVEPTDLSAPFNLIHNFDVTAGRTNGRLDLTPNGSEHLQIIVNLSNRLTEVLGFPVVAVKDIFPLTPSHIMAIPLQRVSSWANITTAQWEVIDREIYEYLVKINNQVPPGVFFEHGTVILPDGMQFKTYKSNGSRGPATTHAHRHVMLYTPLALATDGATPLDFENLGRAMIGILMETNPGITESELSRYILHGEPDPKFLIGKPYYTLTSLINGERQTITLMPDLDVISVPPQFLRFLIIYYQTNGLITHYSNYRELERIIREEPNGTRDYLIKRLRQMHVGFWGKDREEQ